MNCTHVFSSGWYEIQSITNPTKDTTQTCKGRDLKCVKVKKTLQKTKILFFSFPQAKTPFCVSRTIIQEAVWKQSHQRHSTATAPRMCVEFLPIQLSKMRKRPLKLGLQAQRAPSYVALGADRVFMSPVQVVNH